MRTVFKVHSSVRTVTAALISGLLAATAALSVSLGQAPESLLPEAPDRAEFWKKRVLTCVPGPQEPIDNYMKDSVAQCLEAEFSQALSAGEILNLSQGLRSAILERPPLAAPCHDAAHATGQLALQSADVYTIAATYPYSTCEGGFIHGVLDAFGWTNPPIEDFDRAGKACLKLEGLKSKDPESLSNCYHGLGHAAWIAKQDPIQAAELCTVMPNEEGVFNCGEGILMDMYTPAGRGIPHRDIANAPQELPEVCRSWPSPETAGMVEGCAHGAAFALSRMVVTAASKAGENLPYPFPEDVDWETRLKPVSQASREATAACEAMGKPFAEPCVARLALLIPDTPNLVLLKDPGRAAACGELPPPHNRKCSEFERINY